MGIQYLALTSVNVFHTGASQCVYPLFGTEVSQFFCLRLRQWPVTYLITLSDWIMSCQPGRHAVVTVCEPDWKHKWAAYKSFDETSSFNNL